MKFVLSVVYFLTGFCYVVAINLIVETRQHHKVSAAQ